MKILFAASECVPFVKTGGLADVAGTLPLELCALGADIRVILPKYRDIPSYWKDQMQHLTSFYVNLAWRKQYCGVDMLSYRGVTYYFIDNEFYFARDSVYGDGDEEGERFAFFSRAVLDAIPRLGFVPDLIHCNDWQTGMIPALLKLQYARLPLYAGIKTLFTIHNLRYQGVFPWKHIDDLLGFGDAYYTPDFLEFYGCVSFMKGALVFADALSTVSRSYAREITTPYFGERLDGLLRKRENSLIGILNGIDTEQYDPATDAFLAANYDADHLEGKARCKEELQRSLGLAPAGVPLIGMVTRLTQHKGLDLVERVLNEIMGLNVQLVILGSGEEHYCELFTWAAWRYTGRLATSIGLNESLAQRVYAGSDLFLMPSEFEPCGLAQLIAMRYGSIPIVREIGGLRDTVIPYNRYTDEGNGFSFANYNAHEMLSAIERAVALYYEKPAWERMIARAMRSNYSWESSAQEYLSLYARITNLRPYSDEEDDLSAEEDALDDSAPKGDPAHMAALDTAKTSVRTRRTHQNSTSVPKKEG